jgi:hypothetical protein
VVTLDAAGDLGLRILNADNTVGFVPIDLIDDSPDGLVLSGVPLDAKIIVAGQDLVSDGETVKAVPVGADMLAGFRHACSWSVAMNIRRSRHPECAADTCRADVPRCCGDHVLYLDSEGSRAGHQDPDHLCEP